MNPIDLALFAKLGAVIAATVLGLVCLWALLPRYHAKVTTKPLVDEQAREKALQAIYRQPIRPWNAPPAKGFKSSTSSDHDRTVVSLESRRPR